MAYSPAHIRRSMMMISDAIVFVFAMILLWKGAELTWLAWSKGWVTESIYEFPYWIAYISLPIGFGLLALQSLACIAKTYLGIEELSARSH